MIVWSGSPASTRRMVLYPVPAFGVRIMRTPVVACILTLLLLIPLVALRETAATTPPQVPSPSWSTWHNQISKIQTPNAGCFTVSYPSTTWQPTGCRTVPSSLRLQPSTVGDGNDEVAQSPGTVIGSSTGSFQSITGLATETDTIFGANEFGLQANSQFFPGVSTLYTGDKSGYEYSWEQFVFANDPSGLYGTQIFIQYWLINYQNTYGSCPATPPPGGDGWYAYSGSCYANSASASVPTQTASNLANLALTGYANYGSNDENLFCISGEGCYTVALTDQVVDLYQYWLQSEFNVFGLGDGSQANFNAGTSITVTNALKDQSGNAIVPSCMNAGYTAETNNLNLGSCSSEGSGDIVFSESNSAASTVTMTVRYSIVGGGTPTAPVFHYILHGVAKSLTLKKTSKSVSVDTGSTWYVTQNPLTGSTTTQQWYANPSTLTGTASAASIVFTFQRQYYLTIQTNGPGSVSANSGWYNAAQKITITATPNEGHTFTSWTGTGKGHYNGTRNPTTVTMSSAITETANFT